MQQHKKKRLLIMAGGTGGHVFPAIAVAQELQAKGWEIFWLGTKDRMEAQLVPKYGIPIEFIQISGLRGKSAKALLKAPFIILRAIIQAKKIMKKIQPDAVLGMGGYVSGPGGVAAKLCGIPIILHEQNAVAGLTNKWLSKIATKVMQAFPNAFKDAETVGNPVRATFFAHPLPNVRLASRSDKLQIFVAGGSQGAKILNEVMPQFAAQFKAQIIIHHQVGANNLDAVQALYEANQVPKDVVQLFEFIDDIANEYAWADLVICRAGALTVSEIAAVGVGAIFVPFQHKDRQQYLNAKFLAKIGASIIIEQKDFTSENLAKTFVSLNRTKLLEMANIAKEQATPFSAKKVANEIIQITNQQK